MTITFDQLLDVIVRTTEPEAGFGIQAEVHTVSALIDEWKTGNLSNAQTEELLNLDNTDPELATVKTHLNGLTKSDTLALQSAMVLASLGVSGTGITYDKTLLRTRFGL